MYYQINPSTLYGVTIEIYCKFNINITNLSWCDILLLSEFVVSVICLTHCTRLLVYISMKDSNDKRDRDVTIFPFRMKYFIIMQLRIILKNRNQRLLSNCGLNLKCVNIDKECHMIMVKI